MASNKAIKVLHIGKYYPPFSGGIENFMALLIEQMQGIDYKNIEIQALVHQHQVKNGLEIQKPLKTIDNSSSFKLIRVPSYGRLLFAPISPLFPFYLNKVINEFKPDLLHIHVPNTSAFWLLMLAKAKKIPWLIHWHSDVVSNEQTRLLKLAYPFYKPFEQALLKRAQGIICTSPDYLASSQALKTWQDKAHIIPLGLDLSQFEEKKSGPDKQGKDYWPTGKTRLLSIGRLSYYKGYDYLIKAMKHLPDAHLAIVGMGEEKTKLIQLIEENNLTQQVSLLGKVDEDALHQLLSQCHIFCLSSIERSEAFGLVLLEAMAYAKPIVASRVEGSGMNWVPQDRQTALIANKPAHLKDSEDLAKTIRVLIDNPEKAKQLGLNGKKRLDEVFQIQRISQMTYSLYKKLVKKD